MSLPDDRVDRIEKKVEELVERQRLSRFDNTMLLTYPLLIAGWSVFAYAFTNYEALSHVWILDTYGVFIAVFAFFAYLFVLVGGFLYFIVAYVTDDLYKRFQAFLHVLRSTGVFVLAPALFLLGIPAVASAMSNLRKICPTLSPLSFGLDAVWGGTAALTAFCLWRTTVIPSLYLRVLLWLQDSVPRRFQESELARLKGYASGSVTRRWLRFGKIGSIAACAVNAASILFLGMLGAVSLYNILFLVCLMGLAGVMFRRV